MHALLCGQQQQQQQQRLQQANLATANANDDDWISSLVCCRTLNTQRARARIGAQHAHNERVNVLRSHAIDQRARCSL